jgi:hypothetical protein
MAGMLGAGVVDFDLERLSPREFEHLTQGLCIAALGARACMFGDGPDGGREATIAGPLTWDGGRGEAEVWDGYSVVQAKFRGRQEGVSANSRWLRGEIRKELARWTEDRYARSRTRRPDNLLIVTNVRLSAAAADGIDSVNQEISRLADAYCPGLRWRLWHYDDLRAQLTAHAGVRNAFPALITPGDVLASFARQIPPPTAPDSAGGRPRPISELTDPFALEVHRAIEADRPTVGLPLLPLYVKRDHDVRLAEAVQRAVNGQSTIAVLVGGPATGKTRACWEAIQTLPKGWRLWHPISPDRPEAALSEMPEVGPLTVVWLNEAQFYLLSPGCDIGERVAAGLRELMRTPERGPVLVLGTMWPEHWGPAVANPPSGAQDHHAQGRALLSGSAIEVPEAFAGAAVPALRDATQADPRLAQAAREARDGEITQYLAGVPALLERYHTAPAAAKAVIHAAMDARRLGHGPTLPDAFFKTAAPGYLTDAQWNALTEDWLEQALAFAEAPAGVLTALSLVSAHGPSRPPVRFRRAIA